MVTLNDPQAVIEKFIGYTVKDVVTGFEGVAVSITFDMAGCIQAVVSPPAGEKGKREDPCYFDVKRLQVTGTTRVLPLPSYMSDTVDGPSERPAEIPY
jgi:hypothetical protein